MADSLRISVMKVLMRMKIKKEAELRRLNDAIDVMNSSDPILTFQIAIEYPREDSGWKNGGIEIIKQGKVSELKGLIMEAIKRFQKKNHAESLCFEGPFVYVLFRDNGLTPKDRKDGQIEVGLTRGLTEKLWKK